MDVKITVSGPADQQIDNEWRVTQPGDVDRAIGEARDLYRRAFPDASEFEQTIKLEQASRFTR